MMLRGLFNLIVVVLFMPIKVYSVTDIPLSRALYNFVANTSIENATYSQIVSRVDVIYSTFIFSYIV